MPTCSICGRDVGFRETLRALAAKHVACAAAEKAEAERVAAARESAMQALVGAVRGDLDLRRAESVVEALELAPAEARSEKIRAWRQALDEALEDGALSRDEEEGLSSYLDHFGLGRDDVDDDGHYLRMLQSLVLRDTMEGEVSTRVTFAGTPFNLMKSEDLIWAFQNVRYFKAKTEREFRGTSLGASVRVANGVYLRPSQFRGRWHSREVTIHADTGLLGATTKHVYFHGDRERFRVRYDRIVSFEAFDDGIGIMRDLARAKPEAFETGDGWFVYNLVTNLSQMQ